MKHQTRQRDLMTELGTLLLGHSTSQWFSSMLLGAVSGSVAALVSNPFFLLKSRFQAIGSEDVLHQHVHPSLRTAFLDIGRTQAELVCFAMFHCFTHHFSSGTTFFPLPKAPPSMPGPWRLLPWLISLCASGVSCDGSMELRVSNHLFL